MKNLIIPMAGKSTRFPNMRPKWILTDPMSGNLMCVESIKGINLDYFDNIYFTFLKTHNDEYNVSDGLLRCLKKNNLDKKSKFIILEESTSSQSETVYETIKRENISGFIFIKDSDGYFEIEIKSTDNKIVYYDLNKTDEIIARNKSYIQMENNKIITNIVEKKVISPNYCVGGYGFNSSEEFVKFYKKTIKYSGECFISNVIFEMILQGLIFFGEESNNFIDWGTKKDWTKYCSNFSTYFVDLDGTLITNTSEYVPPYTGAGKPIEDNIKILRDKYKNGECKIIITTARSLELKDITIKELKKYDIPYDHLIMDLPHSKRYLINDYSNTNSYPSAISINIERNQNNLKNLI
jgi:hypothetical protein